MEIRKALTSLKEVSEIQKEEIYSELGQNIAESSMGSPFTR